MIINNSYDEEEVRRSIAQALESFYGSLIKKIDAIDISTIMKSKNPYLYRSKAMQNAAEIVDSVLQAFVSSSEETIFGNCFFEPIAIAASNGTKSVAEGIDLEVRDTDNNRLFVVAVKSGTSVFNADSKKKQEDNFNKAKKLATQGKMAYEPIVGYAYGQKQESGRGKAKIYQEVAGEDFWTMLTGDKDFYKKIISFMGQLPEQYVDQFKKSYANASNRLVRDFSNMFCKVDGSIDWEKLVEYNSSSLERQEHEKYERVKEQIIALVNADPKVTKKKIQAETGVGQSYVNRIIEDLLADGTLTKDGKSWTASK